MKTGIKRIEQTLRHLENPTQSVESKTPTDLKSGSSDRLPAFEKQSLSFNIGATVGKPAAPSQAATLDSNPVTQPSQFTLPDLHLPKPKTVTITPHRNGPNPALAASLLQDMLAVVTTWQRELTTIVQNIQNIYIDGPVLDAWLESLAAPSPEETIAFRHADISQLLGFVEKLQAGKIQPDDLNSIEDYCTAQKNATYRLCGINPDGKVWTYPCPAEQIPIISMAIARHHQLRQLRIRQTDLETRLAHFSEDLVRLHRHLKD
jgi:hypothetical protein